MNSNEVATTSNESSNNKVSGDVWIVPLVGNLPTPEYRKLRRLLHDLGRRHIYMRFKYVARLYHSGMLEKLVDFLNETGGKRKRSQDEDEELPEAKRKTGDDDAQTPETKENDDDSALTDYDSGENDSSDYDEDEDEDEDEEDGKEDGKEEGKEDGKEEKRREYLSPSPDGLFRSVCRVRRHVSTQTDG